MGRVLALFVIGVLLLVGVLFVFTKASDAMKGQGATIGKIVIVLAIAAAAYWLFGEGLVFDYLSR
ncbi:MAG: hypothetical protein KF723_22675 [Rhizobiaceae bacterium]|nr:hypothetical protein [Rhizobiaceae bacterium]